MTTIDSRLQTAANQAVANGLEDYDKRHGYRGPEARIDLKDQSTPEQWSELLEPYRPVSGLAPGLVIEVEDDIALVYLRNGQTIALELEEWSAPFITRDRVGVKPKSLHDVLVAGDIIRTRLDDNGNWRLGQVPETEAALVALDPRSGDIKALVGGYDFNRSKFNRIIQSRRQPGSSFKPFIYSAALAKGFTTASLINDAPIVFDDADLERSWKPQNFSEKFYGPTRLREAMVKSRNLVSVRLLRDIGIDYARNYITAFGFDPAELPENLTMALGSASVTPLSMARGFAVFANGGYLVKPEFIREIHDATGNIIYQTRQAILCDDCPLQLDDQVMNANAAALTAPEFRPLEMRSETNDATSTTPAIGSPSLAADSLDTYARRVISPQNAYLVRSMMMDVIRRGTGARVMQLGRNDLAGKTGTTNEQRDAWFSGYNDDLVTSVWVGFDNHDPLGRNEQGGRAALPIWMEFMGIALQGTSDHPPEMPEGLAQAKIDPATGLIAKLDDNDAIVEIFEAGKLPPMQADAGGESQDVTSTEDPYENY
jgi:penicillin-binding protein 1A